MFTYLPANKVAGYSGWVVYTVYRGINGAETGPSHSIWMIPGTFEDDWDNQIKEDRRAH